jgi:hypothetical protein
MPDMTRELIEMTRRINDLDAEVRRLRGGVIVPQRRFPFRHAGMALVLALGFSMTPSATGPHTSPVLDSALLDEIRELEGVQDQASLDLVKRIKALEDKLAQPLTVKAPFQVLDPTGKVIVRADFQNGQPLFTVGGTTASGGVALGVGTVSGAGFVSVSTQDGQVGTQVGQFRGAGMGVHILGPDGQTVEATLGLHGTTGKGRLTIGDASKGGATLGQGTLGGGFASVRRADGKLGISLGQLDGRPMGVDVFGESGKELVSMRTDSKGGTVRVMTPAGVAVAALLAGENGGGVALTGPSGGKSAVSIGVEPSGGKVRVFPAGGGPAQAELTAEVSGGAVTLYNSSGTPSALLSTGANGAGALEISRAGTVYVEAGVLPNGVGVVRAGPKIGGPPIGALGFANTIIGKVQ